MTRAVLGYWAARLRHSHRWFGPLLVYAIGVVVLTANDSGPVVEDFGSAAAVLFVTVLWLTVATLNLDEPAQRHVVVVNAGGSRRVVAGGLVTALGSGVAFSAFGLVFPLLSGHDRVTAAAVAVGVLAHLVAAGTGVAGGALCSRLVAPNLAVSVVAGVAIALAGYFVPAVAPVHALLQVTSADRAPSAMLAAALVWTVVSGALVVGALWLTDAVATRLDR